MSLSVNLQDAINAVKNIFGGDESVSSPQYLTQQNGNPQGSYVNYGPASLFPSRTNLANQPTARYSTDYGVTTALAPAIPTRDQLYREIRALFPNSNDFQYVVNDQTPYKLYRVTDPYSGGGTSIGEVQLSLAPFPNSSLPSTKVKLVVNNADTFTVQAAYEILTHTERYPQLYSQDQISTQAVPQDHGLFYLSDKRNVVDKTIVGVSQKVADWYNDYWLNAFDPVDGTDTPDGFGINHDRSFSYPHPDGGMTAFGFGWDRQPLNSENSLLEAAKLVYKIKTKRDEEEGATELQGKLANLKGIDAFTNQFIDGKVSFAPDTPMGSDGLPDVTGFKGSAMALTVNHKETKHNGGAYLVWLDPAKKEMHVEVWLMSIPGQNTSEWPIISTVLTNSLSMAGSGLVRWTLEPTAQRANILRTRAAATMQPTTTTSTVLPFPSQ